MDKKLEEYRAKKGKDFGIRGKGNVKEIFSFFKSKNNNLASESKVTEQCGEHENLLSDEEQTVLSETSDIDDTIHCSYLNAAYYMLWFILWLTVYAIFIKLQFGTVFLISSALVGICINTRTKPKRPNEISAYSVFNRNCESIDGTLKAEQFERELRYGR